MNDKTLDQLPLGRLTMERRKEATRAKKICLRKGEDHQSEPNEACTENAEERKENYKKRSNVGK